jgi:Ca2+-binding EF-hand superfamily protein
VEAKRLMAERLFKLLDVDRDGVITRTEFLFSWKNISKQVLTLKGSNIPKGLACVIL